MEKCQIGGFWDIQQLADMVISVDIEQREVTMWLDAHDRYKGLPMNLRASSPRWFWDPASRRFPALHGDVLLVGDVGSTFAVGEVPPALLEELLHGGPYLVELLSGADGTATVLPDRHDAYAAFWALTHFERTPDASRARITPAAV